MEPGSKSKVQSFKFENAPQISQRIWNLEPRTLNYILLQAASCLLLAGWIVL
jgi:hypothetical protein